GARATRRGASARPGAALAGGRRAAARGGLSHRGGELPREPPPRARGPRGPPAALLHLDRVAALQLPLRLLRRPPRAALPRAAARRRARHGGRPRGPARDADALPLGLLRRRRADAPRRPPRVAARGARAALLPDDSQHERERHREA